MPLLWMFSTRPVNQKINRIQEIGLRALLNETSIFDDILSKRNDTTILTTVKN